MLLQMCENRHYKNICIWKPCKKNKKDQHQCRSAYFTTFLTKSKTECTSNAIYKQMANYHHHSLCFDLTSIINIVPNRSTKNRQKIIRSRWFCITCVYQTISPNLVKFPGPGVPIRFQPKSGGGDM